MGFRKGLLVRMIIFYIDTEATKINYADGLANEYEGQAYNASIEFDSGNEKEDRKNHRKAMDEIMQSQVLGFSNNTRTINDPPSMTINDLNLHEDGYLAYCRFMAEKDCLVVRAGQLDGESEPIMRMHRAVVRFMNELEVLNPK